MRIYSKNYASIKQKQQRLPIHWMWSSTKVPPVVWFPSHLRGSLPTHLESGLARWRMGGSIHPPSLPWPRRVGHAVNTSLKKMILACFQHLLRQPIRGFCALVVPVQVVSLLFSFILFAPCGPSPAVLPWWLEWSSRICLLPWSFKS